MQNDLVVVHEILNNISNSKKTHVINSTGVENYKTVKNGIYSKIINFTNCFMRCRQNTVGTGKPTIQHCILFVKKLARFLKNLRTSNKYRGNADAVMIEDVDDVHKLYQTGVMDELNVTPSNAPAGMDTVSSITFKNFNDKTTTFIQGENTIIFKIISGITRVLFLQSPHIFYKKHEL